MGENETFGTRTDLWVLYLNTAEPEGWKRM